MGETGGVAEGTEEGVCGDVAGGTLGTAGALGGFCGEGRWLPGGVVGLCVSLPGGRVDVFGVGLGA